MSGDAAWWTLPALGALVGGLSLGWAMASWRLTGARLRVHVFLYRRMLVVWVFNAGRTADSIEKLVLGGTRGGIGGHDLTWALGPGPVRLEPGQAWRKELDPSTVPAGRLGYSRRGWDSVWLLLGSMRQRRAELVPLQQDLPPSVGWRLAPRRVKLSRYGPAAAVAVVVSAASSGWSAPTVVMVGVLGAVVLCGVFAWLMADSPFQRLRAERWALAAGLALAVAAAQAGSPPAGPPQALQWAVIGYVALAGALAVPGAVPALADGTRQLRSAAGRLRAAPWVARGARGAARRRLRRPDGKGVDP